MKGFVLALGALCGAVLLAEPASKAGTAAERWWSHIVFLADDKLDGRDTGSEGHKVAARYVAQEFERAGLKPAGKDGYLQPVKFQSFRIEEAKSSLELSAKDRSVRLTLGEEAYFNLRSKLAPSVEAPMVFAGYGFAVPEQGYDELAGLDVKGKIVVTLNGGPKNIPAPLLAHYQSAGERWKRLKAAGAIGVAAIPNPKNSDIPWERARLSRFLPSMKLAGMEPDGPAVAVAINPSRADLFLEGSGHTMEELLRLADSGQRLPKFPLKWRLKARQSVQPAKLESDNVAGVARGSHPQKANEYVVLSAHLDHIGVGANLTGDRIYNGAMDNASGIATLIETARELSGKKHDRSILFVAVTGEEKGLLGSQHFSRFPTVPKQALVADLNYDMFLPLFPFRLLTVYGLDESTLGANVRSVAKNAGIGVQRDPEPLRNSFIRSDQYSFIQEGIPSLAFKLGYAPGSEEEQIFKSWLKERYHAVGDDIQQPVDKEAAAQFNRLMAELAIQVANEPERPRWLPTSFFRRFAK